MASTSRPRIICLSGEAPTRAIDLGQNSACKFVIKEAALTKLRSSMVVESLVPHTPRFLDYFTVRILPNQTSFLGILSRSQRSLPRHTRIPHSVAARGTDRASQPQGRESTLLLFSSSGNWAFPDTCRLMAVHKPFINKGPTQGAR